MHLVLSSFCSEEDVVQGDWRPIAHSAEYTVGLFIEVCRCVELSDLARVEYQNAVVGDNGTQSVYGQDFGELRSIGR